MDGGRVQGIFIGAVAEGPMSSVGAVRAVSGRGLEGDRYFQHAGSFSERPGGGREVTLIEWEALEAARRDHGVDLGPGATRRNIVTVGVALNDLVGREFTVGEVLLRGIRLCEPCAHMARLAGAEGAVRALVHRGGLRANVVRGGTIRSGDPIGVSARSEAEADQTFPDGAPGESRNSLIR
ncbi:MAG TPA: MOSC domain-containing protein [Actinomycetota bacterium]